MVRDRDPFGLALSRLRESLRDGLIPPGQPLLAAELASGLKISATPVREALSRLAGEGLVEDRRGRGFYVLRPGAAEIEQFYALHRAYIALALDMAGAFTAAPPLPSEGATLDARAVRSRAEQFWSDLIHRASAGVLVRAHLRLTDQLAVVRLFEPLVLTEVAAELEELTAAAAVSTAALHEASRAYHARRHLAARALESRFREAAFPLNYIPNIV